MERYSIEWKLKNMKKYGGWPQQHNTHHWEWHYVENATEYSRGCYFTRREALDANGHLGERDESCDIF